MSEMFWLRLVVGLELLGGYFVSTTFSIAPLCFAFAPIACSFPFASYSMPPDGQLTCARWPKLWRSTLRALSSNSAVVRHHGGGFCFVLLLGPVDYISRMVLFSATLQGSAGGQVLSHLAVTSCCRLCLLILLLEVGSRSLRRRMVVVAAQGGPYLP